MSNAISIKSIEVKMNDDGMFCLNDLHKASGGESRHEPSNWTRTDQFSELADEIFNSAKVQSWKKSAGRYGGTFVCKELVYAYAMWISPKFHIDVIRVFDGQAKAKTELDCLVGDVKAAGARLTAQINKTSVSLNEIKAHGHFWGAYGQAIKKAKREAIKELEDIKSRIQIELDFIG